MVDAGGHDGTWLAFVPCTVYAGGRATSAAKQVNVNELDHGRYIINSVIFFLENLPLAEEKNDRLRTVKFYAFESR
jgi:hypothetical protein